MSSPKRPKERSPSPPLSTRPFARRTRLRRNSKEKVKLEGFWFEDGNILLKTETHEFRVYRGILAKQSVFFRETFKSLPGDAMGSDEVLKRIPTVHINDAWEDIRDFLNAVFTLDHGDSPERPNPWMLEQVTALPGDGHVRLASLLEMCLKYEAMAIQNEIVRCLATAYYFEPFFNLDWSLETERTQFVDVDRDYTSRGSALLAMVRAARSARIQPILPMAFYRLACLPLKELVQEVLDPEDLHRCVQGREKLIKFNRDIVWSPGSMEAVSTKLSNCKGYAKDICKSRWDDFVASHMGDELQNSPSVLSVRLWGSCTKSKCKTLCAKFAHPLCRSCQAKISCQLRKTISSGSFYQKLPDDFFGLDSWADLWRASDLEPTDFGSHISEI